MALVTLMIDFDGVIRRWPTSDYPIEQEHGLPENSIRQIAFSPVLLEPAIRGEVADSQWRANIANELQHKFPDASAEDAVREWSLSCGAVDSVMIEFLADLSHCSLVLATNATDRLYTDLKTLGLDRQFQTIINSSDLGFVKPEPAFYRTALGKLGASSESTLFVDDSLENTEAAISLGISSHQFVGLSQFEQFIADVAPQILS